MVTSNPEISTDPAVILSGTGAAPIETGVPSSAEAVAGVSGPPAAAPTSPAPAPTQLPQEPTLSPEIQRRLARVAELEALEQQRQIDERIQADLRVYQQQLIARGIAQEDASWLVEDRNAVLRQVHEERAQLQNRMAIAIGKQNAARQIGQEFGVDPSRLLSASSPEEMKAIAQREKHYLGLETRLNTLEKRQVPGQPLNSPAPTIAGGGAVTTDNIDKLWVDEEVAIAASRTGRTNRYDKAYRTFLGR